VLFATGAVHTGSATQSLAVPPTSGPAIGAAALHPAGLYGAAVRGVVDITAHVTTTVPGPFGPTRQRSKSSGSGIVVDRHGDILTADHVVRGASSMTITFADGATRVARMVGQDATTDLAVLALEATGPSLVPLGSATRPPCRSATRWPRSATRSATSAA
jgi:putative serine protease PepD